MPRLIASLTAIIVSNTLASAAEVESVTDVAVSTEAEGEVFFEETIRPILAARCFECHGAKKQEGGIRLDSRATILRDGDAGPAVVSGKPDESRLLEVVGYADAIKMPPQEKLSDDEISSLTDWVKRGVPFPEAPASASEELGRNATLEGIASARQSHWAFQPLRDQPLAANRDSTWEQTRIDNFILAKLEAAGVWPNPPADKRTLLRRATFDLIGLPPTEVEVADFVSDASPNAFARVVDRLLASPHYGERWGRHWLDVARYADTKGYSFAEEPRFPYSYTYRDYVVRAFNSNLPFDRFVLEQLAADQLDLQEDKAALAAIGFLTVGRRFRNDIHAVIDDRIDVVTRGLLGLTVTCARCHDHKYDPITTDDYYSLYGVFANSVEPTELPEIGPSADPVAYADYQAELTKREEARDKYLEEKRQEFIEDARAQTAGYLNLVVKMHGKELPPDRAMNLRRGELRMAVARRWRDYLQESSAQAHPIFAPWHALSALPPGNFAERAKVLLAGMAAVAGQPKVNRLVMAQLGEANLHSMADVSAVYGKLFDEAYRQWVELQKPAEAARLADAVEAGTATAATSAVNTASREAVTALPDAEAEALRDVLYLANGPTDIAMAEFEKVYDRDVRNKVRTLRQAVDNLTATSAAAPPRAMVLYDAKPIEPARVLIRGNPSRRGKEVPRQFPQVLRAGYGRPFDHGSGRLELAQAIVDPRNPLTARVIVNRVWLHHFGKALVATPSDFGYRGAPPTHPELLDYLARILIEGGWSLKKLHRQILLSSVYQQSSVQRIDGMELDPDNFLLWRMNRQRLEFEPLRDALLAASGRLDRTVGGRPVSLFTAPISWRRTIYGLIDRQDLAGTLRIFDFASPDVSMPQRPQTTIPQQALYSMNSPFVIAQARQLAARPEVVEAVDAADRVRQMYRLIYARVPTAQELAMGMQFLSSAAANELPTGSAESRLTLLEQYAQVLLSANEFVFVD